ncbi:uncharacterized protein [Mycetomoellerius zeteki]|uniref:uncharacterized protein n=1 Tax=Mycetomoellerius zeteki TaxID=64791 RepID=UPI00084E8FF7|nr:PREDICTED: uncharacterized protein LOC108729692 [Trachymyrmex zeteki]
MNQVMVAKSTCQERHYNVRLTGSHLCTLNRYEIGTCAGDSDGSLICNGAQYGVISYGFPCAQSLTSILISISISINLLIMPKKTCKCNSQDLYLFNVLYVNALKVYAAVISKLYVTIRQPQ